MYAMYIKNWLKHFSVKQIVIIDGELLKSNPHISMDQLQDHLDLNLKLNYKSLLKYDKKKKFFCWLERDSFGDLRRKKCLGQSKGRKYIQLSNTTRTYLNNYFYKSNMEFYNLLIKNFVNIQKKFSIPKWLNKNLTKE